MTSAERKALELKHHWVIGVRHDKLHYPFECIWEEQRLTEFLEDGGAVAYNRTFHASRIVFKL